jgi:hypothetical protein
MKTKRLLSLLSCAVMLSSIASAQKPDAELPPPGDTEFYSPVPPVVSAPAGKVPSDAIVLFDGSSLDGWESVKNRGQPAPWRIEGDAMVVSDTSGDIRTKQSFGDVQLHLEYRIKDGITGKGQLRGNSGVFLMGRYEVQVLDSYQSETYVNGQTASIYKQYAPLVNASRAPGEWQTYDIIWIAPRFAEDGALLKPAQMTVLHNGVLVHHAAELKGPTVYRGQPSYKAHAEKLPIVLQEHKNDTTDAVAYRNIWVREIATPEPSTP